MRAKVVTIAALVLFPMTAGVAQSPNPAAIDTSKSATPADQVRYDKAWQFAELLAPEDIGRTVGLANFQKGLRIGLANNPQNATLEKQYPGLTDAMVEAMSPRMAELIEQNRPPYLTAIANLFSARFTAAELDQGLRFYRQPFMVRTTRASLQNFRSAEIERDLRVQIARGSAEPAVSGQALRRDVDAGIRQAASRLTPAELRIAAAFSRTPFAVKMMRIQPELQRLVTEQINEQGRGLAQDEKLHALASATAADFIVKAEAQRSGKPGQ